MEVAIMVDEQCELEVMGRFNKAMGAAVRCDAGLTEGLGWMATGR